MLPLLTKLTAIRHATKAEPSKVINNKEIAILVPSPASLKMPPPIDQSTGPRIRRCHRTVEYISMGYDKRDFRFLEYFSPYILGKLY